MKGFKVPVMDGRSVLVRPAEGGRGVQLAIVSTYGNIMDAVCFDASQLPGVLAALRRAGREADRNLAEALRNGKRASDERYRAALARNPWLNGKLERERRTQNWLDAIDGCLRLKTQPVKAGRV